MHQEEEEGQKQVGHITQINPATVSTICITPFPRFHPLFLLFYFHPVRLQLTWVPAATLSFSLSLTHSHPSIFTSPLNSAFEIIKARIFQRAVPAKLVFCFDSAIDRTSSHVLSITLFVLLDIPTFQWNLYRLTNALDSFFSFSHFLKPVKGSLSLTRYSNIIFLLFNGRNIYIAFTDVMQSTVGFRGTIKIQRNFSVSRVRRASRKQMRLD